LANDAVNIGWRRKIHELVGEVLEGQKTHRFQDPGVGSSHVLVEPGHYRIQGFLKTHVHIWLPCLLLDHD